MHYIKDNQFFVYALLMHVAFYIFFMGVGEFVESKENNQKAPPVQVQTYDSVKKPVQQRQTQKKTPSSSMEKVNSKLDKIEKQMLSYVVEKPSSNSTKGTQSKEKAKKEIKQLKAAEKDFNSAQNEIKHTKKALFKRSKELDDISKTYATLKDKQQEVQLNSPVSTNKNELRKSKDLLLAYESYQKSLYNEILSNWVSPQNALESWECRVKVIQNRDGKVQSMRYEQCVDDERFRTAVKLAIYRSSPFSLPTNDAIFNEVIYFNFQGASQ